jgi:hypothetical protein
MRPDLKGRSQNILSSDVGQYDLEIQQGGTVALSFQWSTEDDDGGQEAVDLTGCHIRARVFAKGVPNPALELTDEDGDFTIQPQSGDTAGWFDLLVTDERTDQLFFPAGSWRLDILHPAGRVTPLLEGLVAITPRTGIRCQ